MSEHCTACHEFYLQQEHEDWMRETIARGQEIDDERRLEGVAWGIAIAIMSATFVVALVAALW